ncbi:MAG TPA: SusC/RagA family TonB-linked outer membrane protein [Longimicrobiales bacterium]|nr:SusC/RagA family TonB-linked outer membrane protein [Longimicrobiales bacterium]
MMRTRMLRSTVLGSLYLVLALPLAAQQTGRVQGRVIDAATNRPLVGVQVFIPPTGIGNLTDSDGRYLLQSVPAGTHSVTAQRIGYRQAVQEVTVPAGALVTVDLSLSQTAIALDEIVVTGAGMGTERRKLGNSIVSINADRANTASVSDVSQLLAGREPGVAVLPSGGYTGQGARIRIRGSSSLSQNNEPVIYVDGIRVDNTAFSSQTPQGGASKLDDIPPESIERIEVLKGAAAATLYGTEASNGVIQIFTKKGRAGAPRFTVQVDQTAIDMPLNRVEPLWDFAYSDDDITRIQDRWGLNVDLYEPFTVDLLPTYFDTGHHQAYSVSVTGGSEFVNYFVTGRFTDEDGPAAFGDLFPDIGLEKINDTQTRAQAAANIVVSPIEKVRIGVNTMYSEMNQTTPNNGNNIYGVWPNLTQTHLRLACGEVGPLCPKENLYGTGAFITANESIYQIPETEANHFTGSVNVNYTPITPLRLDGTFGIDFVNESGTFFRPFGWNVNEYVTAHVEGLRFISEQRIRVVTADFKASWEARFADDITNRLLAGSQGFLRQATTRNGTGVRFPGPGLEVAGAGADQFIGEFWNRNTQVGVYLDNQVGWRDWAFLTAGARWDANSAFGEAFNTAFYPKLNASILPTQAFGWTSDTFSTIRLRAAIGKSGLQPSSFAKFTTYEPQPSTEGPGVRPDNLGNQNLRAEVATEIEAGAEVGLFNDRASFNITYWTADVQDAIVSRQFAVSGGFINRQLDNIGELHKHGVDLGAQGTVYESRNLSINLFVNGAYLQQEITDMGGAPALKTGGSYSRYRQYLVEGFAPGSFFGAKTADVAIPLNLDGSCTEPSRDDALAYFAVARDPGEFKPLVVANSGFGTPTSGLASHNCGEGSLATYLGKSTPDWQGTVGFNLGFLGNFEVNSLWEFKLGNFVSHDLSGEFRRTHAGIGRNTENCVKLLSVMRNPSSTADARLESAIDWANQCEGLAPLDGINSINPADHVRWRELSVTYRVPTPFVARFGLASAQLSVGARNLALWVNDAYTGMDPEAVTNGRCDAGLDCNFLDNTDLWQLPIPRRITFSTRVSF